MPVAQQLELFQGFSGDQHRSLVSCPGVQQNAQKHLVLPRFLCLEASREPLCESNGTYILLMLLLLLVGISARFSTFGRQFSVVVAVPSLFVVEQVACTPEGVRWICALQIVVA